MKRKFLQFYYDNLESGPYVRGGLNHIHDKVIDRFYALQNGFSSIWDLANPVWVRVDPFDKTAELPVEADEIYCSVWMEFVLSLVWKWAEKNPKIKFICGGPAIWPLLYFKITEHKPKPENLIFQQGLAEDIFNVFWQPDRWRVELPEAIKSETCMYSYYVYDECYWGKCTFCRTSSDMGVKWKRGINSLHQLESAPPGMVWLSGDSMPVAIIEQLPDLPLNKKYSSFLRAGNIELEALKKIIAKLASVPGFIQVSIGVEFPSNRMLKLMNKGINLDTMVDVLNLLTSHPSFNVVCTNIVGWSDLVEEDIDEAEKFFANLEHPELIKFIAKWLIVPEGTKSYKSQNRILGYFSQLNDRSLNLNKRFFELLARQDRSYISTAVTKELGVDIKNYWRGEENE